MAKNPEAMPAQKQSTRRPKKYPHGAIVPSKCRYRKSKIAETVEKVGVAPLPQKPGFLVQDSAGNTFLLNDWPATGGPWAPIVVTGAGVFAWYNTGGG